MRLAVMWRHAPLGELGESTDTHSQRSCLRYEYPDRLIIDLLPMARLLFGGRAVLRDAAPREALAQQIHAPTHETGFFPGAV